MPILIKISFKQKYLCAIKIANATYLFYTIMKALFKIIYNNNYFSIYWMLERKIFLKFPYM